MTLHSAPLRLAAALVCVAGACAGPNKSRDVGQDWDGPAEEDTLNRARTEASVNVTYAKTPQDNYARGEIEFADENYLAAQKFYAFIRSKFPYSGYATKAELRIADCLYGRQRWLEAIDGYQTFVRIHPTHESVGYASYRIGAAYYEQIPSDWFLVPPSFERDQATLRDAARALKAFVDRYPRDPNIEDGQKLFTDVRRRLVSHERAVADFYKTVDKYGSTALRLETIKRDFGDVALDDALLAEIVDAWSRVPRKEKAETALRELETKFPRSERLAKARAQVAAIPAPPAPDRVSPEPAAEPVAEPAPEPVAEPAAESVAEPAADEGVATETSTRS